MKCLVLVFLAVNLMAAEPYKPEAGSAELKKKKKGKKVGQKIAHDPKLPNVLIIGDSISIGYTGRVQQKLKGVCNVIRPKGNHQGTTYGLTIVDKLLAEQKKWEVIHFNWGLHDLKHVKVAGTSQNSNDENDPQQADLMTYSANLESLTKKLKASGAKMVFATTTAYPDGVSPLRKPQYAVDYNKAAKAIMKKHGVVVNDLHALTAPRLKELQIPKNVHFKPAGSEALAEAVAEAIKGQL
jgi:acyl-CoA thioesterase-1